MNGFLGVFYNTSFNSFVMEYFILLFMWFFMWFFVITIPSSVPNLRDGRGFLWLTQKKSQEGLHPVVPSHL